MTTEPAHLVRVALGDRSYHVEIGADLITTVGARVRTALHDDRASRAFVVFDHNVPDEFIQPAVASLEAAGFRLALESAIATERDKSLGAAERLLNAIARTKHERTDPVVAIGGGIVGDVAGFVAATYRRGVPVIQCPTTLLAMVDASVGGKTGVNLAVDGALLKNMAGAFWQPKLVVADIGALRSLPDRQMRAGLAECLKHGLISASSDPDLFTWTNASLMRAHVRDEDWLAELVARNVAVKAAIVTADEREESADNGGRALLNLGHTFAHAIETIPHLTPDDDPAKAPLLHGEAVALGLIAACATSVHAGRMDDASLETVRGAVAHAGLPTSVCDLPDDARLLDSMRHDKKVTADRLRLVLPIGAARSIVTDETPEEAICAGLSAIRADA